MFDPKKAALLILSKGDHGDMGGDEEKSEEGDGSSGSEALKAMFSALKSGNEEEAYDAFRAAVQSCDSDDYEE